MLLEGGAGGAGGVDRPASRLSNLPAADIAITNQGFTLTKFILFVRGGGGLVVTRQTSQLTHFALGLVTIKLFRKMS